MIPYRRASSLLTTCAAAIAPPIRRTVTESARLAVRLKSASGAVMPWDSETTPYMQEPMDMLETRTRTALVFIGPAQSGKTQGLIDCWIGHIATASPSDIMIIQATQSVARDFERDRWRTLRRNSPEIAAAVGGSRHDDNTFDKLLRSGDIIYLKWPSENELQGKSLRRIALTDYDRMPLSIGGQGNPFDLARKRARKFRSLGMTLAESSPGHEQTDPKWRPATPHQAPPAPGIFSLYNLGDRRRLYWPCPHCNEYIMSPPGPEGFVYDVDSDLLGAVIPDSVGEVSIACPQCGAAIDERHKQPMLTAARWVPEGCTIDRDGQIQGQPIDTDIASYWLHGVHAAFADWRDIIRAYLQAKNIYQLTHNEESMRTVIMQDFGAPYVSQARISDRSADLYQARIEDIRSRHIPDAVRYLTASVDVQINRFCVQIIGHGPGRERWVIDRYDITHSQSRDHHGQPCVLDPAARLEDWDQLTARVLTTSYPLVSDPDRRMSVRLTVCDSGGRSGVTRRAYDYCRRLRRQGLVAARFALVKGIPSDPTKGRQPTIRETFPDSTNRSDRRANARGDIPLYLLHVNELKDQLAADLKRSDPGPGYIHIPAWIAADQPQWFDELAAEVRTEKGWEIADQSKRRNEAWDLLVYDLGADLIPQNARGIVSTKSRGMRGIRGAAIDWTNPPPWAGPHEANSEIDNQIIVVAPSSAPMRANTQPRIQPGFGSDDWAL